MSYIGQGLPADVFSGFTTDAFTGDGSATTFTLSKAPFSEDGLIVVINNVIQRPTTNFTVSGTTLTIVGTAVASGDVIYAIHTSGAVPSTQASKVDVNGLSDGVILDADADTTISADTDDQIDFKAGGTDIMSLTATTATFNDGVEITTADNTDTLMLTSTDADAAVGPNLKLFRNSSSPAADDLLGAISFAGEDAGGNDTEYALIDTVIGATTDGSENGRIRMKIQKAGTLSSGLDINADAIIINDDSKDIDFRVESDGNTNALFIEGGSNRNGMFLSTADLGNFNELSNHSAGHLVVGDGSGGNAGITIFSANSANGHLSFADGTSGTDEYKGIIQYRHGSEDMQLYTNHTAHFKIASDGTLTATDTSIGAISSDQRLKENIQDYSYDISKFKTMKPRSFDWKFPDAHPYEAKVGFVAQELETVDSELVITEDFIENTIKPANFDDEKALLTDGKKKTTKLGKKDAMYISIIQQLISRIEALESA